MDANMATTETAELLPAPVPKVLLVDLENCPGQLHQLPSDLANYRKVVICYAQSGAKVPLKWLASLSEAMVANRLTIQEMPHGGKNSADFGICFLAGMLMQEMPPQAHFVIVSNDTDLDHAVQLLRGYGRSAERVGIRVEEKPVPVKAVQVAPSVTQVSPQLVTYCTALAKYVKNRPAKNETLRSDIKSKFQTDPDAVDRVYGLLVSNGIVMVTGTKVAYDDKKVKAFATA